VRRITQSGLGPEYEGHGDPILPNPNLDGQGAFYYGKNQARPEETNRDFTVGEGSSTAPDSLHDPSDYNSQLQSETMAHIPGAGSVPVQSTHHETSPVAQGPPDPLNKTPDPECTNEPPPTEGPTEVFMNIPLGLEASASAIQTFVEEFKQGIDRRTTQVICSLCASQGRLSQHNAKLSNLELMNVLPPTA
ncbi:hypothetical protein FRC11_014804, partial [Ceratobasidium sp. 423]